MRVFIQVLVVIQLIWVLSGCCCQCAHKAQEQAQPAAEETQPAPEAQPAAETVPEKGQE